MADWVFILNAQSRTTVIEEEEGGGGEEEDFFNQRINNNEHGTFHNTTVHSKNIMYKIKREKGVYKGQHKHE